MSIVANSFLCCGFSNSLEGSENCHIRDCIPTAEEEKSDGDPFSDTEDEADQVEELQDHGEEDYSSAEL